MYQILIIGLKLGHIDHCVIGSIHIFRKNIEKKKFGEIFFFGNFTNRDIQFPRPW